MTNRFGLLAVLASGALMFTAAPARAASEGESGSAVSKAMGTAERPWRVSAEGSLVNMRDNWLQIPTPEVGLTVGRDLTARLSVELTGRVREVENARRSWSAMALGRGVLAANATGHHALTIAGGPFFEIDNPVHGTIPFAHAELAYVYRSSFGLTVLAGAGPNVALASSSYVTPPSPCANDNSGDGNSFCIDLGPDAQELHAGDITAQLRLAVGWQF